MLNFAIWLEEEEGIIKDKAGVAQRWLSALPGEKSAIIESEVWVFVEAMANPKKNGAAFNKLIRHISFPSDIRYGPKKICGNLLTINSDLLKDATGQIISNPRETMFGLGAEGDVLGELLISHPPLVFAMEDKALLASIIRHELRHGMDIASMGGGMGIEPSGSLIETDFDGYLSHVLEARAYSDQLRWLLQIMGNNIDSVLRLLRKPPFGFSPDMVECSKYFLQDFIKSSTVHESLGLSINNASKKSINNKVDKNVETAARLVAAIMEGFRFKNYVR